MKSHFVKWSTGKKDSELFEILKKAESRIQGSKDPVIQESKKKRQ